MTHYTLKQASQLLQDQQKRLDELQQLPGKTVAPAPSALARPALA